MGILDKLFGKKEKPHEKGLYRLLDPLMKQFMGRCIGAVKKAGIEAKGTDQFSILIGKQGVEVPLDPLWDRYQDSQNDAVFDAAVKLAQRTIGVSLGPTVANLYPYVIPEDYLEYMDIHPTGIIRPLGHRIHVGLVFDLDGLVEGLTAESLAQLNMTSEQAHRRAVENLQLLARTQQINLALYPDGPKQKPFVVVRGHWASATAILLPGLRKLVQKPLASDEILASIPHRDAMLLFPMGDRESRDGFRAMI